MRTTSLSVNQAAASTATLVPAKAGYRIEVTSVFLTVENGALGVESTLQDGTANTVRMTLTSESATSVVPYMMPGSPEAPLFQTAPGESLELVTGVAAVVAGLINWRYVAG